MNVIVPLAPGFEEIEAVTIIDILRRASITVTTAAISANPVTGSHNITITADRPIAGLKASEFDSIVCPGGMPGSANLKKSSEVLSLIREISDNGGYVAAICAAPIVLGAAGILTGKKATCFPGHEKELIGATIVADPVVVDGTVITGKGAGCAIPFSLKLVELMKGKKEASELKNSLQVYGM